MNNMRSVSVGKGNIRGFLGEIFKELGELVGPAPVGGTIIKDKKDDNETVAEQVSKVVAQQSDRVGYLEETCDSSNLVKNQGKGKESRSKIRTKVENPTRQTSRQIEKGSKGRTSKGYEQEL